MLSEFINFVLILHLFALLTVLRLLLTLHSFLLELRLQLEELLLQRVILKEELATVFNLQRKFLLQITNTIGLGRLGKYLQF